MDPVAVALAVLAVLVILSALLGAADRRRKDDD